MADEIHMYLSAFRDSMLTAVARLEFQLRDSAKSVTPVEMMSVKSSLRVHEEKLAELAKQIASLQVVPAIVPCMAKDEVTELLKIEPSDSKNVLVPVGVNKQVEVEEQEEEEDEEVDESEEETEQEDSEEEEEVEPDEVEPDEEVKSMVVIKEPGDDCGATKSEVEEEQEEGEQPSFEEFEVDGETLYRDEENSVYRKTSEGEYEQIGEWDPNDETLALYEEEEQEDEAQEDEEAEQELECEPFVYKGNNYLIDADNNVYNEEGEEIGVWDGKKIIVP